ncbi:MAG: 6-pyruvoyl-tetrahydropterin synthase-related protein [Candidatus Korobacteraceae bacterium]
MPAPHAGLQSVSYGLPRPRPQHAVDIAQSRENAGWHAYWMIALAATLAVLPIAFRGNPWGHDVNLHLRGWMDAAQQFHEGTVFPRWAAGANMGFGEPFFIFYPPLSRLVGMALGLVLPWKIVSGVYIWLMLLLAGVSMWKCAGEWLAPADALVASLLFTVNPYLLIIAYKRGNYADLLACSLLPLLIWAGIRMGSAAARTMLPLAAVFAALWLSDLPAAVVASYSLAALLVIGALASRSLRPILFGAIAIVSAFGSIAFFLFPAAWERRWVSIAEAVRPEWAPEHNFLFTHNNLPQYVAFNRGLSWIAVFLVVATAIAAFCARRLRQDNPWVWRSLTALAAISTFMMFSPSLILYKTLPEMEYVEFPWRWLSPLSVAGVLLVAAAVAQARKKWMATAMVSAVVVFVGGAILYTANWDTSHYLEGLVADAHSSSGYPIRFGDWSNPVGSQLSKLEKAAPLVAADEDSQIEIEQWSGERKVISVVAPQPGVLRLRLLGYPAWQAKVNGNVVGLDSEPGSGQMLLPVPAGSSRVEVEFGRTWDRRVGNIVSMVTILTCVPLMWWWGRRDERAAAS